MHATAQSQPIVLHVDETDAPRKIMHATLDIPVQPGALTLLYPKWIPGEHGPTGPIDNFTGLLITGNNQPIRWQRDDVNMFAFHLTVPQGVSTLHVRCDFLATAAASGFSAGASTSANLAMLSWNEVLLYPQGSDESKLQVQSSITLPTGWHFGTALTPQGVSAGENTNFAPVSVETLIDSPLLAGRFFREIPLAPDVSPKHFLDLAGDGPEDLELSNAQIESFSNLVRQADLLYKSHHYESYHFLVTLSDQVAHFGLEHHQSSDDRVPADTFLDPNEAVVQADLLPHEFTHSWNGKYRRPAGLATGNYEDPMKGELLWVYEGLTQYLGDVLAARSNIETADQYRDALAYSAARLDARPGRTWRDLQDTATAAQILYETSNQWDNWRRTTDYYQEGELLWLDVDTWIREKSAGKKSLNDFIARFHGLGGNTAPKVIPYTFENVVENLNAVQPNDWSAFLKERLTSLAPHAPLDGIARGGYKLTYTETPSLYSQALSAISNGYADAWWSLGFTANSSGTVGDVLVDSPAYKAGLGPTMTVVAVNGRQFSPDILNAAITGAKTGKDPIELIVNNTGFYKILHLDYHDGLRYPHLERVEGKQNLLDAITKPLATALATSKK